MLSHYLSHLSKPIKTGKRNKACILCRQGYLAVRGRELKSLSKSFVNTQNFNYLKSKIRIFFRRNITIRIHRYNRILSPSGFDRNVGEGEEGEKVVTTSLEFSAVLAAVKTELSYPNCTITVSSQLTKR